MPRGKPHTPTAITRRLVEELSACGIENALIADRIGIAQSTLYQHYKIELQNAVPELVRKVATSLTGVALSKKHTPAKVTACIYILKARGKHAWRDDFKTIEHVGADGTPLQQGGDQKFVIVLPDNGRAERERPMKLIEAKPEPEKVEVE